MCSSNVNMDFRLNPRLPYFALAVGMFAISTSAILIRFSDTEPLVIGSYRQSIATLFFLPFIIKDKGNEFFSLSKSRMFPLLLTGIILGGHFGFFISAVQSTSIAASVLLATCHIVYVVFIGRFFYGDKLNNKSVAGICVALTGILVLFGGDLLENPGNFNGNILAFVSGILAGFYYLSGYNLRKDISLPTYAFVVYFFSALSMWLIVVVNDLNYRNMPLHELQLFFLMALIPTLLGHTMQNWALGFLPAYVVSVSLLAEPVGSSFLAWIFFEENPGFGVLMGGSIVLIGVYLVASSEENDIAKP